MVAGEAAGLAEEDREDIKPLVVLYMPKMYNNQPDCAQGVVEYTSAFLATHSPFK